MQSCTLRAPISTEILPELDEVWAQILTATPGSRLLLYPFNPNWNNAYPQQPFLERFTASLARHGVPSDRLLVFNRAPGRGEVLSATTTRVIVYLDSYPFADARQPARSAGKWGCLPW